MNSETFPQHLITQDRVAVALERQIVLRYAKDARTIVDVGCGTGETMRWLANQLAPAALLLGYEPQWDLYRVAIDAALQPEFNERVFVLHADHTEIGQKHDLIYTQRMLIQLPTWEAQYAAIQLLRSHLTPKGRLVCVEPNLTGLWVLNELRRSLGLSPIVPPAHTHYITPPEFWDGLEGLISQEYFGQRYSFLSRVVEAYRAQQEGREPRYMDPESVEGRLCLALSDTGECFGQYHYSVWGPM